MGGRLAVDVGMAVVRPAGFITLRVMRTMQKAWKGRTWKIGGCDGRWRTFAR